MNSLLLKARSYLLQISMSFFLLVDSTNYSISPSPRNMINAGLGAFICFKCFVCKSLCPNNKILVQICAERVNIYNSDIQVQQFIFDSNCYK